MTAIARFTQEMRSLGLGNPLLKISPVGLLEFKFNSLQEAQYFLTITAMKNALPDPFDPTTVSFTKDQIQAFCTALLKIPIHGRTNPRNTADALFYELTQQELTHAASTPIVMTRAPDTVATPPNRWTAARQAAAVGAPDQPAVPHPRIKFELKEMRGVNFNNLESHLQQKVIPLFRGHSIVHELLQDPRYTVSEKAKITDLMTRYAVKSTMGDFNTDVKVDIVKNNNSDHGHEPTTMKIQFKSDEEARNFSKRLLEEHGIHSLTFGKGVMKTPQQGAVYLTKHDLAKMSFNCKLTNTCEAGYSAYQALVETSPGARRSVDRKPEEPSVDTDFRPTRGP